jgi:hypothetical protein
MNFLIGANGVGAAPHAGVSGRRPQITRECPAGPARSDFIVARRVVPPHGEASGGPDANRPGQTGLEGCQSEKDTGNDDDARALSESRLQGHG